MSIQHEEDVEHSQFVIDSEPPHANLYSYNGVLHYSSPSANTVPHGQEHPVTEHARETRQQNNKEAITINELLLRGCAIRNTVWVIGIVVYTGQDTKIMLNQGKPAVPACWASRSSKTVDLGTAIQAKHRPSDPRLKRRRTSMSLQIL